MKISFKIFFKPSPLEGEGRVRGNQQGFFTLIPSFSRQGRRRGLNKLNSWGYGLIELCIAMVILAMVAETLAVTRLVVAKSAVAFRDRSFAKMKALQMMEELQAQVNSNPWYGAALLDGYKDADGPHANPVLTTDKIV